MIRLDHCISCGKPQPASGPSMGTWSIQCHSCDDKMTSEYEARAIAEETRHHRLDEQWRDPEEDAKAGCL